MSFRLVLVTYALLLFSGKLSESRRLLHTESVAPTKERFVGSLVSQLRIPEAAPFDTAFLKVLYPAKANFSSISKDRAEGSYPVVLFFSGAAIESNRYQWLGEELVRNAGVAFVSYDHLDTFNEDNLFFTPSFSQNGSQIPPSSTILSLLDKLSELNSTGVLAGKLDLERVIIGGHSLGGRFALIGADSEILSKLKGVFVYGTPAPTDVSYRLPTSSVQPVAGTVPLLWMAGTRDRFFPRARSQIGTDMENATVSVRNTYFEGLVPGRAACFVELDGANHLDIVNPVDSTLRSTAVDFESTIEKRQVEHVLAHIITAFVQRRMRGDTLATLDLQSVLSPHNQLLSDVMCNT